MYSGSFILDPVTLEPNKSNLNNIINDISPDILESNFGDAVSAIGVDTTSSTSGCCWKIIIYISADNDLEKYAVKDIKEMLAGSKKLPTCVKIYVQIDRHVSNNSTKGYSGEALPGEAAEYTGARRYEIKNGTLILKQSLGEVDMGQSSTLANFTKWAQKQDCNDSKTALIIWNHGMGDSGVGVDEGSNSQLSLRDVRLALEQSKNDTGQSIDLLGFDACHMAAAEAVIEFKDLAKIMVGSEEVEPGDGWDYKSIFERLGATNGDITPFSLGGLIVDTYEAWYKATGRKKTTLVSIDLDFANDFTRNFRDFTKCLNDALNNASTKFEIARAIEYARNNTYYFDGNNQIDLNHFLKLLISVVNNTKLESQINELMDSILLLRNHIMRGSNANDTYGVSIYFKKGSNITWTYNGAQKLKINDSSFWEPLIRSWTDVYKNNTYRTWVRNNPVNVLNMTTIFGRIFPNVAIPTSPASITSLNTFNFDFILNSLNSSPGGMLYFYERQIGHRTDDNPFGWIEIPEFTGSYQGTIQWSPSIFGWAQLAFEYVPYGPQPLDYLHGNNPFFYSDYFWIPYNGPHLVPQTISNITDLSVDQTQDFSIDLFNGGSSPFTGDILVQAIEENNQIIQNLYSQTITSLNPGASYNISLSFTPTISGIWDIVVSSNNERLGELYGPREFSPPNNIHVYDPSRFFDVMNAELCFVDCNAEQTYYSPLRTNDLQGNDTYVRFHLPQYAFIPTYFDFYLFMGYFSSQFSFINVNYTAAVNSSSWVNTGNGWTAISPNLGPWSYDMYGPLSYGDFDILLNTSFNPHNILRSDYRRYYQIAPAHKSRVFLNSVNVDAGPPGSPWVVDLDLVNLGLNTAYPVPTGSSWAIFPMEYSAGSVASNLWNPPVIGPGERIHHQFSFTPIFSNPDRLFEFSIYLSYNNSATFPSTYTYVKQPLPISPGPYIANVTLFDPTNMPMYRQAGSNSYFSSPNTSFSGNFHIIHTYPLTSYNVYTNHQLTYSGSISEIGTPNLSLDGLSTNLTIQFSGLPLGNHSIFIVLGDENFETTTLLFHVVTTGSPDWTLSSTLLEGSYSGTIYFDVTSSKIADISIKLDEVEILSELAVTIHSFKLDTYVFSNGNHELRIIGSDGMNNKELVLALTFSNNLIITTDLTPNQILSGTAMIAVTANYAANASVLFDTQIVSTEQLINGTKSISVDTRKVTDGSYTLHINASAWQLRTDFSITVQVKNSVDSTTTLGDTKTTSSSSIDEGEGFTFGLVMLFFISVPFVRRKYILQVK